MENKPDKYNKRACACCGFFTISEIKETCPVCFWEEDSYQEENIDDNGGPNSISLRKARENYQKFGAIDRQFEEHVRSPTEEEMKM